MGARPLELGAQVRAWRRASRCHALHDARLEAGRRVHVREQAPHPRIEIRPPAIAAAHASSSAATPSTAAKLARARCRCVFTVLAGRPIISATSFTGRSSR